MKMKEQRFKMPTREELELYMQHKLGKERSEEIDKLMETTPLLRESVEGYLQFPYVSVLVSPASDLIGSHNGQLNGADASFKGGTGKGVASSAWQATGWVLGAIATAGVIYAVWMFSSNTDKKEVPRDKGSIQQEQTVNGQNSILPQEEVPSIQQEQAGVDPLGVQKTTDAIQTEVLPQVAQDVNEPALDLIRDGVVLNLEETSMDGTTQRAEKIEAQQIEELSYNMVLVREYNNSERPIADLVKSYNRGIDEETRVMFISNFKIVDYTSFRKEAWPNVELGGVPAAYEKAGAKEVEKEGTTGYLRFIENGIFALVNQEYASSYQHFQQLLREYPDDVNGLFYSGLVKYYLGDYGKAREFFGRVQTSRFKTFNEESEFYAALSLWESGSKDLASEELAVIAARRGFYAKRALSILRSKE